MKTLLILFFLLNNVTYASDWKLVEPFDNTETKKISDVESISCYDNNLCYALVSHNTFEAYGPQLFKSTDGGLNWFKMYHLKNDSQPPKVLNINEGVSPNPNYYFIAAYDNPVIMKSSDGGITFKKIRLDLPNGYQLKPLAMGDTNTGFVSTNGHYAYFTTTDGWETSQYHIKIDSDQRFKSPFFIDSNTVAMAYYSPWANDMDLGIAFVKYHINENKWDTIAYFGKEPNAWVDFIYSIDFVNDSLGFACGRRADTALSKSHYYDIVYRTKDGGYHWELVHKKYQYPEIGFYNNISFADENNGIAVGFYGKIAMTNDGGDTWVYEPLPNPMDHCRKMLVTWCGQTPLIGTWDAGIFRYEGDFFKFPPDTINPIIIADDCDFGKIDLEKKPKITKSVKITNKSDKDDLIISAYSVLKTNEFKTNLPLGDTITIKPLQSYKYFVTFIPTTFKEYRDSIIFYCNAKDSDFVSYFDAVASFNPNIQVSDYDFGQYDIDKEEKSIKLEINNLSSEKDLIITAYSELKDSIFTSDLPEVDSLNPLVIKPNEKYEFTVVFNPKEPITYIDSLVFYSNANFTDNKAYLQGEGVAFPTIQAEDYDFGQYSIYNTDSISAKLQIQNTSLYKDLKIYKYLVIGKTAFTNDLPAIDSLNPITIKPNGSYAYNVSFKPEEVKEYKGKIIFYSNSKYSDNVANLRGEGIDTTTSVVDNKTENHNYLYYFPPYPTPSRDIVNTLIYWDTSIDIDNDKIDINDIFGNKIGDRKDIVINKQSPYSGILTWNCSGFPNGIYFILINHGTEKRTIKVIVNK